ncbi:MAG: glycosylase, partial [Pseudomonadota bacterium]|nr:glycosylase [Pseudomonadota bacterium]
WEKLNANIIEYKLGLMESQASPDVIFKNGTYHLFFCYRAGEGFRNDKTKSYRIGYARSSDLINWKREDEKVGIDVSHDGWDSNMISYPHVFELDGEIIMLYLGNEFGRNGFGLAKLEGELI